MSYLSDVAIGMSLASFRNLWESEKELVDEQGSLLDKMTEFIEREDGTVILYWEWIDWNSAAAQRINDFLGSIDSEGLRSYAFVKIGEELDDVEEYYIDGLKEEPITSITLKRTIDMDSKVGDCHQFSPDIKTLFDKK